MFVAFRFPFSFFWAGWLCTDTPASLPKQGKERLKALADTTDGFEIAERDLQLRGPGDFFGTRQSGLPTLRTGDLLRDHSLMEQARQEAVKYLEGAALTAPILETLRQTWPTRFGLMDIG